MVKRNFLIPSLFLVAIFLSILPFPATLKSFLPEWVPLLVLFFSVMNPERVSIFLALILGLILDSLSGSLLGQHALALVIVFSICIKFHLIVRVFPIWQLNTFIILMLIIYEFILFWIDGAVGNNVPIAERIFPIISSILVWPVILSWLPALKDDAGNRE